MTLRRGRTFYQMLFTGMKSTIKADKSSKHNETQSLLRERERESHSKVWMNERLCVIVTCYMYTIILRPDE